MSGIARVLPSVAAPAFTSAAILRGSRYVIDLGAIRHNYRQLRTHLPPSVRIYACLKRNGYGCGAGPVAGALAKDGADGFAVASLLDAVAIRSVGVTQPILLYPGTLPMAASTVTALDLTISLSSIEELEQWRLVTHSIRAFIKLDLGFFRAGATPRAAMSLLTAAQACPEIRVEGLYAHMSELPTTAPSDAFAQLSRMQDLLRSLEARSLKPPVVMMSSTKGVLKHPEMDFDAVDPGALFVGLPECADPVRDLTLQPALKAIATSLVAVKCIDPSLGSVPYIPGFRPGMCIGVLGMGSGDGIPRTLSVNTEALIRGKRVRLLAPVHLEHVRVDLSDVPEARFGDEVILLGRQGDQYISHAELAAS